MARPRFNPTPCKPTTYGNTNVTWTPIITCPADFPASLVRTSSPHCPTSFAQFRVGVPSSLKKSLPLQFEHAISQLIHHPEYNSTLILRSEVIDDSVVEFPDVVPVLEGLQPIRNIHRRLLPRRPTRDAGLEQHCTLYAPSPSPSSHPSDEDAVANSLHLHTHPTALVLTPILPSDGGDLPYYHPTVTHLAFRFVESTSSSSGPAADALRIDAVPLSGTSLDPGARLYRTCLSLLETLHRYGWGALTNYKKRVAHDVLVPRETYQDLYLVMRERHKHLINDWQEVTDPLKHVFEVRSAHSPRPSGHIYHAVSRTSASQRSSCSSGKIPTVPRPSLPMTPSTRQRTWNPGADGTAPQAASSTWDAATAC